MSTGADAGPVQELQFDRAIEDEGAPRQGPLLCAGCGVAIEGGYFQVGGAVACAACKDAVHAAQESAVAQARRATGFLRALALGFGAAVAGAAIYYGVIALTNFELALVALLIGWMVGWAVRRGSRGFGGRRYQVLALTLTYFSVGLAYTPIAFKGLLQAQQKRASAPATTSGARPSPATTSARPPATPLAAPSSPAAGPSAAPATTPAAPSSPAATTMAPKTPAGSRPSAAALLLLVLVTLVASLVLPIVFVVGSLPSGILSAVIIGVGMRQAWKMTAAYPVPISGPYQVGTGPASVLAR